jgi:hypothetical protein
MLFGYRTGVALTSLVLATTLHTAAAPADRPCLPAETTARNAAAGRG